MNTNAKYMWHFALSFFDQVYFFPASCKKHFLEGQLQVFVGMRRDSRIEAMFLERVLRVRKKQKQKNPKKQQQNKEEKKKTVLN